MTEQDYELLSAYLDGELNTTEREALEARLMMDSALRDELEALRRTVALVRALPELRAPRNYTLDPAIYGRHPAAPPKPILAFPRANVRRLLIAAASVMLAFVAVVALLTNNGLQPTQTNQVAAMPTLTSTVETAIPAPSVLGTMPPPATKLQASTGDALDVIPSAAADAASTMATESLMRAMRQPTATLASTLAADTASGSAPADENDTPSDAMFESAMAAPTDADVTMETFSMEAEEAIPAPAPPVFTLSMAQVVVWVNVTLVVWGVLRMVLQ